ncbi:hypothetical protein HJFPF1_08384 [Paramyrothecium foliicola]|nr:hypothetical protein HJFPF1_08384 [Paramyrothecium foliicola]
MSHDEMISFLHAVTGILVPLPSINQTLKAINRSTKSRRCVARRQDAELRSLYLYRISRYETNQLVFVDQSADDDKKGRRRKGWSPCESSKAHYQIVPAYTQDGVLLFRVFTSSVTAASFEDFIKQLLSHCGRWPAPNSVLVMEDTPCHNREITELLCAAAGVKLLLLPPDSADLNPVGGLMSGLENFIEKSRDEYKSFAQDDFEGFLSMCMGVVGCQQAKARHHFKLAGLSVEEEFCK